jgi:DNA-binding response OmpR family regulator
MSASPALLSVDLAARSRYAFGPMRRGKHSILVADGDSDCADSLSWLLELYGHIVYTAYSGTKALEIAEEEHPSLSFLDIGLPDLNGYDLAQRIRQSTWADDVTLVAVSGFGTQPDILRTCAAGFDLFFLKPIEMTVLDKLLQRHAPPSAYTDVRVPREKAR